METNKKDLERALKYALENLEIANRYMKKSVCTSLADSLIMGKRALMGKSINFLEVGSFPDREYQEIWDSQGKSL